MAAMERPCAEAADEQPKKRERQPGGEGEGAEAEEGGEQADEERACEAGGDGDAAEGGSGELGRGGSRPAWASVRCQWRLSRGQDGAEQDSRKAGEDVGDVHERERGARLQRTLRFATG